MSKAKKLRTFAVMYWFSVAHSLCQCLLYVNEVQRNVVNLSIRFNADSVVDSYVGISSLITLNSLCACKRVKHSRR